MAVPFCAGRERRGLTVRAAVAAPQRETDPKKRIVITGMGLVSCFGNDIDVFYDKLLDGVSGVDYIDRFDAAGFPTKFAAQIKNFDNEGLIDGKNDRRLDDCLRYALVSGKKALLHSNLGDEELAKVSWPESTLWQTSCTPLLVSEPSRGVFRFGRMAGWARIDLVLALTPSMARLVHPPFYPHSFS